MKRFTIITILVTVSALIVYWKFDHTAGIVFYGLYWFTFLVRAGASAYKRKQIKKLEAFKLEIDDKVNNIVDSMYHSHLQSVKMMNPSISNIDAKVLAYSHCHASAGQWSIVVNSITTDTEITTLLRDRIATCYNKALEEQKLLHGL